ncbi:hypothetical protein VZ95_00570 [Elstera litoralis]|uniref:5'-nucleotidase n=1 Tax=Elstera litoralis TaxID=552518 RepID=A0A0F3IX29_9PROT|nr:hypothetical protein [Elstera litoralis]KJV11093.1 hypothetical protein VZ95_00570 [Elstera litoralis]
MADQPRHGLGITIGLGIALGLLMPLALGKAARADTNLTLLFSGDVASRMEPSKADGTTCTLEERTTDACLGGLARLAGQANLERARAGTVLLLNAGGQFGGTAFWNQHKQDVLADLMNRARFDAMAAGAAEFSEGSEVLGKFIRTAQFPILGANISTDRDPYLKDQIYPMLSTDRGAHRLGLLGIADLNATQKAKSSSGVLVSPIEAKAPFWLKQLGFMGTKTVVAVSSAGVEKDKDIAARIAGIDVIIGVSGKGAQAGAPPAGAPQVVTGPAGKPVLLVQGASFGHYLGKLSVVFDKDGHPKSWKGDQIRLDRTVPEDPDIHAQVEAYAAALGERRTQVSQLAQ